MNRLISFVTLQPGWFARVPGDANQLPLLGTLPATAGA